MAPNLDEDRWRVIRSRTASTAFVYAVKSTGIYCLSNCPGRLARRANVAFFDTGALAQHAGFRACKRCQPDHQGAAGAVDLGEQHAKRRATAKAKAVMSRSAGSLAWKDVAKEVGLTPRYLFEAFKSVEGVTPGVYASTLKTNSRCSNSESGENTVDHCTASITPGLNDMSVLLEQGDDSMFSQADLTDLDVLYSMRSDNFDAVDSFCSDLAVLEDCLRPSQPVAGLSSAPIRTVTHNDTCEIEVLPGERRDMDVSTDSSSSAMNFLDEWSSWIDLEIQPA